MKFPLANRYSTTVSTVHDEMPSDRKENEVVDLDTAITMAGLGKFHIGLAIVAGGCLGSSTADNLGNGFVLPNLACELELSAVKKGIFSSAMFLGMVLTAYGWGFASDTFGRRGVLIISIGSTWLASFCASLAPVFWLIVSLRFIAGAASAGMATTVFAYMAEFFPPNERSKYFSLSGMFNGIAYCVMPATAWFILPLTWSLDLGFVVVKSWRMLSLLNGSYILITFLGMLWFPESPKYLVSINKHNEAIDVLRRVFSTNTGRPPNEYPVLAIKTTAEDIRTVGTEANEKLSILIIFRTVKEQISPIFGSKYLFITILSCILQFCIFSSSCGFYLWMPDILNRMMSYNSANPNSTVTVCETINIRLATSNATCQSEINPTVYVSSLAIGANYCVGFLLITILMKFLGEKILLTLLQFVSGIAGFGLYFATDTISVGLLSTVYIVQSGLCYILISSMISDLYPTHLRSAALCISMTVGRLGSSLTGAIIGILIEYDCTSTIFGLGAVSIGTGLLIFLMPRPGKINEQVTLSDLK